MRHQVLEQLLKGCIPSPPGLVLIRHLYGDETLGKACGTMLLEIQRMIRGFTLIPKWMVTLFVVMGLFWLPVSEHPQIQTGGV